MTENEPSKRKPLGKYLYKKILIRSLPAAAQAGVRFGALTAFVLLSLSPDFTSNAYLKWVTFFLAVYGLWKLFDRLDDRIGEFLNRNKIT